MNKHTKIFSIKLFSLLLLLAFCLCSQIASAQPTISEETKKGISLYNKGNYKDAVEVLKTATKKNKDDIEALYYLGMAYSKNGKKKDANKAFEKATKQAIYIFVKQFDEIDKEKRKTSFMNLTTHFEAAQKSAEQYIVLNTNMREQEHEDWSSRVTILKHFADASSKGIYTAEEVTTKAHITYNPQPEYAETARMNKVSGIVKVSAILGADGEVKAIIPINGLPDGLTENAIKAAQRIRFMPAIKDGVPVSQWVTLEYSFRIY